MKKKLFLKKEIIANLSNNALYNIKGGDGSVLELCDLSVTCPISPNTDTKHGGSMCVPDTDACGHITTK